MEEVPGSEESLLAFDEQPALTGQNEEGLLIRLGVVNAALAGLEDGHIDPELRELDRRLAVLVGEPTRRAPRLRREPLGVAHVDDKPTLRDGGKPGASVLKPRFVHAADSRSPSDGCLACASAPEYTPSAFWLAPRSASNQSALTVGSSTGACERDENQADVPRGRRDRRRADARRLPSRQRHDSPWSRRRCFRACRVGTSRVAGSSRCRHRSRTE